MPFFFAKEQNMKKMPMPMKAGKVKSGGHSQKTLSSHPLRGGFFTAKVLKGQP